MASEYIAIDHAVLLRKQGDEDARRKAVDAGAATMNGHLGGRYVVPVVAGDDAELAAWLERINLALAMYQLSQGTAGTGQKIAKDYAVAMSELRAIRDGKQVLPGAPKLTSGSDAAGGGVEVVGADGTTVANSFPPSLFGVERSMLQ